MGKKTQVGFLGELKSFGGEVEKDHWEGDVGGLGEKIQNVFFGENKVGIRGI